MSLTHCDLCGMEWKHHGTTCSGGGSTYYNNVKTTRQITPEWIDRRLGQLGIDVRQSGKHVEMRCYLELLKEEIQMTEEFLKGDGATPLPTDR